MHSLSMELIKVGISSDGDLAVAYVILMRLHLTVRADMAFEGSSSWSFNRTQKVLSRHSVGGLSETCAIPGLG
jgi:hypothetical protein